MLRRRNRFHGHGSLNYLYRKGTTHRAGYLSLRVVDHPRQRNFRAAVVVSKKVSKVSPVRNRIRRRIYNRLRAMDDRINPQKDFAVTVFDRRVATMPAEQLDEMLLELLRKGGLLLGV